MNSYTQLLYYIKQLGEADIFVNTVTKSVSEDLDIYKGNIFPILNIEVTGGSYPSNGVIRYTVELTCIDLRDINKEIETDKFWSQDNEVDNLNETQAVLSRVWLNMIRDFADNNITASESPTLIPLIYEGKNIYDGWQLSFDVDIPNTTINICVV
jgi:hypothetical protein|tara:strand:+ start:427 stop:891 length:465 start_codon:yes stop_codon:yes gene_type:complete